MGAGSGHGRSQRDQSREGGRSRDLRRHLGVVPDLGELDPEGPGDRGDLREDRLEGLRDP